MAEQSASRRPVVSVVSDIGERKRAEQILLLEHAIARCLAAGGEASATMRELIRTFCKTERWDCGVYFRFDAPAGVPRPAETWGVAGAAAGLDAGSTLGPAFAPALELISRVWRSGEAAWVAGSDCDAGPKPDGSTDASTHATLAFPVTADGTTLGVLSFFGPRERTPEQSVLQAAGAIGSQIGQFLRGRQREEELRESEARYRALAELSSDWYWEQDENQRLTKVSDHVITNAEIAGEVLLGKTRWEAGIRYDAAERAALEADIEARRPFRDFNFTRITTSGAEHHVQISGEPMHDAAGRYCGYRGIGRDVTERVHAEKRLAYLAQHDALTGLANRELLRDRLAEALTDAERNETMAGVLYLDLDEFKDVNDSYGHEAGDLLLTLVAERLRSCVRRGDTVGRLGGDEFAIVLTDLAVADEANLVAEQVVEQLAQPFDLEGRETLITASIGIAIYPIDGADANSLLRNADTAMYQGKEQGRNNFQSYSVELDDAAAGRKQLATELRQAIEHEEFELHYQPQVSLDTGRVIGVEAMLRWWHPVYGMLAAGEFIDVAEETGLIVQIGHWVFETACKQTVEWQRAGLSDLFVAVNVSPVEILRGRVVEQVQRALECSGLAPHYLEIELTESVAIEDVEAFTNTLTELKDVGVSIAIDDFGTGYSSLKSLKTFPIDKIKIDQTLTQDIATNPDDSAIVQAVIAMAHHLRLEVVSKGVESKQQAGFLRRCRCDSGQGFLFGAPMQAGCLKELLDSSDGRLLPLRSSLAGPVPQFPLGSIT
jgi:diguanylate cyclase (GGDEF)-like protein/PAS domain S-box-containing protein